MSNYQVAVGSTASKAGRRESILEPLPPPNMTPVGQDYVFTWTPTAIQVTVSNLTMSRDGPRAEVFVRDMHAGHLHAGMLNLLSTTGKHSFVKALTPREPNIDWADLVEQFCVLTVEAHRAGDPMTLLEPQLRSPETAYYVNPLMPTGVPTLIYGDGSAGKSYLAAAIGRAVTLGQPFAGMAVREATVGYFDWEWDEEEHSDRLYRLGRDVTYFYRQCSVPLAQQTRSIGRLLDQHEIDFLIVDSLGYACGGDIRDPDVVLAFFSALRVLNRTTLVIHHVPKESKEPYGSVYIRNSVRSAWYMLRSTLPEPDSFCVALRHGKTNRGRFEQPIGLEFTFGEETTTITRTDSARATALLETPQTSKKEGILAYLETDAPATAAQIAVALREPTERVSVHLSQLRKQGRVQNSAGSWALASDRT